MRGLVRCLIALVVTVCVATTCWLASRWERQLADTDEKFVTLESGDFAADYDAIARSMTVAGRLPWFKHLLAEVREHRAVADYWQSRAVEADDADPAIMFVAANSAYRASLRGGDRAQMIQHLDTVLQQYARVLAQRPDLRDAAYDYEYITGLRNLLAKSKDVDPVDDDLTSMHGRAGGKPEETNMKQFKTLIPKQPEERTEGSQEAGKGQPKRHKG